MYFDVGEAVTLTLIGVATTFALLILLMTVTMAMGRLASLFPEDKKKEINSIEDIFEDDSLGIFEDDSEGLVYDVDTWDEIGTWNPETNTIEDIASDED